MKGPTPWIAVLGAGGLIGEAVASGLAGAGWSVAPVARRFSASRRNAFGADAVECPVAAMDAPALARLLSQTRADVVVNCIGILQDSGRERADDVHHLFILRLMEAIRSMSEAPLLVHLSIPGHPQDDATAFSRSKRAGERAIAAAGVPYVILRPGFVIAPAAYGGSALMRALAAAPFALPSSDADRPLAATDIADVVRTIHLVAARWRNGERDWACVWDVMAANPSTVGSVVDGLRRRFGGSRPVGRLPGWLLDIGAWAGDLAAGLGWRPPIRRTALQELRRGVWGDPEPWMTATGIEPIALDEILQRLPSSVQERWFARLFLLKALMIVSLVVFWCLSGLVALTAAFEAATAILTTHGIPSSLARLITVFSSLGDICVGAAIAVRRTCRTALVAGIGLSIFYLTAAALITPDLWIEPLGALMKTVPAIVLMLTVLAILDDR